MARLTKKFIEDHRKAGKDITLFDQAIPGFGLHVRPSGVCTFIYQYRYGGRTKKLTLGRYGLLPLQKARKKALQAMTALDRGEDPARAREEARTGVTVEQLAHRYLQEYLEPKRKASTLREFRRTIQREILPRLGHRRVADLTLGDLDGLHRSLRSTPVQANRTLAILAAMLTKAEKWGLRPLGSNPSGSVERFHEDRRDRFLSPTEFQRLGEALTQSESEEHPSGLLAIRLLLLTGMRRGEVLQLEWDQIDFENGLILLPDSKTGRKRVSIGLPALRLLEQARRATGNPYVCYGTRFGASFQGLQKVWERVRKRAGLDGVRLHDLRHSFASVGAAAGENLYVIGKVLGHAQASTTQRYAHLADDPIKAASERISAEIEASLSGHPLAAVIPLRR